MKLFPKLIAAALMTLCLNAADVAGAWTGSMETPMGTVGMTITLQPGASLTGTVKTDQFGEAPVEKGKLDGDKISFEIKIEPGKVAFEGTVAGDEMKLTVTGTTGNKYPLNCKRQK
jgi:hypothetical protein